MTVYLAVFVVDILELLQCAGAVVLDAVVCVARRDEEMWKNGVGFVVQNAGCEEVDDRSLRPRAVWLARERWL
jgi:hypothetical protein